jgi:hypothetical protein
MLETAMALIVGSEFKSEPILMASAHGKHDVKAA